MSETHERTVEIVPEAGLHARPAAKFVETANEHDATVRIGEAGADDDNLIDAGSMIAVTSLGVKQGERLRIVAEGEDSEEALDALERVLSTPEGES
ncbi:HPr family phosphocarrier protein [Halalkalicoccus sp. NIPERK01]|uniref:HPr family phosphocarrier protein n=1 Tax=Halalkalicoccus sp. NIPERK01 TaxID=3053469 RepID=UPI00256F169C|nr:HPr family phosphocarrier protein [Halalkalicoccus sp. NIPERK01]MDL5360664.1 HPr family phosphocarrier protein [Halalkalicoccus sp. NIPERK01]